MTRIHRTASGALAVLLFVASGVAEARTTFVTMPFVPSTMQTGQTITSKPGKVTMRSSKKTGANGFEITIIVKGIEGAGPPPGITGRLQATLGIGTNFDACDNAVFYNFSPVQVADGKLILKLTAADIGFPELPEGTVVRPCNLFRISELGNGTNELFVSTLGSGSDPD
jgi:hypothetical protein